MVRMRHAFLSAARRPAQANVLATSEIDVHDGRCYRSLLPLASILSLPSSLLCLPRWHFLETRGTSLEGAGAKLPGVVAAAGPLRGRSEALKKNHAISQVTAHLQLVVPCGGAGKGAYSDYLRYSGYSGCTGGSNLGSPPAGSPLSMSSCRRSAAAPQPFPLAYTLGTR